MTTSQVKFPPSLYTNETDSDLAIAGDTLVTATESLLERLIDVHSTSPTFRAVFQSNAVTQSYIDSYKSFVTVLGMTEQIDLSTIRVLEKLSHFGLSIALDNVVPGSQKQDVRAGRLRPFRTLTVVQIMDTLQSAEALLNPRASQETSIDPTAVVGAKPRRRRMASRMSTQIAESTVKRSIARIHDWRESVISTERKRLRKTVLDLYASSYPLYSSY